MAPTLTTNRLTLLPHQPHDLDEMIAMWEEPAVHALITGRPFTRQESWERLLRYIGHWEALGWGNWLIRETATGRLVGNAVSDQTGTIEMRATYPNSDGVLVPGQLVDVNIALKSLPKATVVPHDAVTMGPDGPFVYLVTKDNRADMRPVKVLYDDGAHAAVAGRVKPGDRVAAVLPNIPQAVVAFLAANAVGAVWSSCSPDFGKPAITERFAQIEPKVLFTVDGYVYNGKAYDITSFAGELSAALPSVADTVLIQNIFSESRPERFTAWDDILHFENFGLTLNRYLSITRSGYCIRPARRPSPKPLRTASAAA